MSMAKIGALGIPAEDDVSKNTNKWSVENMIALKITEKLEMTWAYKVHYLTKQHFDYL